MDVLGRFCVCNFGLHISCAADKSESRNMTTEVIIRRETMIINEFNLVTLFNSSSCSRLFAYIYFLRTLFRKRVGYTKGSKIVLNSKTRDLKIVCDLRRKMVVEDAWNSRNVQRYTKYSKYRILVLISSS
jgi:hypothetical protein